MVTENAQEAKQPAIRMLDSALAAGTVAHAYLFTGGLPEEGKALAASLASSLNCLDYQDGPCGKCIPCKKINEGNHPDIHWIEPVGASLKINQVRRVKQAAYLQPHEGRYQVFILDVTGSLALEAANSLLKILEEPPPATIFVLLAGNPEKLPSTVVSRCQLLSLGAGGPKRGSHVEGAADNNGYLQEACDLLTEILSGKQISSKLTERLAARSDLAVLTETLLYLLRDLLLYRATSNNELLLYKDKVTELDLLAAKCSVSGLQKSVGICLDLQQKLGGSVNARLALERALRHLKEDLKCRK